MHHARHRPAAPLSLLLVALLAVTGCTPATRSRPEGVEPGGTLLTREDIAAMKVKNAMEAVERARTHLVIQRTREGTPARVTHRGVNSLVLDPQVVVIVDGTMLRTVVEQLTDIPAESIEHIQILSGREAALKYGAAAGNGAILVRTTAG